MNTSSIFNTFQLMDNEYLEEGNEPKDEPLLFQYINECVLYMVLKDIKETTPNIHKQISDDMADKFNTLSNTSITFKNPLYRRTFLFIKGLLKGNYADETEILNIINFLEDVKSIPNSQNWLFDSFDINFMQAYLSCIYPSRILFECKLAMPRFEWRLPHCDIYRTIERTYDFNSVNTKDYREANNRYVAIEALLYCLCVNLEYFDTLIDILDSLNIPSSSLYPSIYNCATKAIDLNNIRSARPKRDSEGVHRSIWVYNHLRHLIVPERSSSWLFHGLLNSMKRDRHFFNDSDYFHIFAKLIGENDKFIEYVIGSTTADNYRYIKSSLHLHKLLQEDKISLYAREAVADEIDEDEPVGDGPVEEDEATDNDSIEGEEGDEPSTEPEEDIEDDDSIEEEAQETKLEKLFLTAIDVELVGDNESLEDLLYKKSVVEMAVKLQQEDNDMLSSEELLLLVNWCNSYIFLFTKSATQQLLTLLGIELEDVGE